MAHESAGRRASARILRVLPRLLATGTGGKFK